jgi:hypothetical protein
MRVQLRILVSSLSLGACAYAQRVSAPDVHSADLAVYLAVLDSISFPESGARPTQLVVMDRTRTAHAHDFELDRMPGVDSATIIDFEKRNTESRSLRYLSSGDISVPIVLVTQQKLDSFMHNGPEAYWSEFYRRYPGSFGTIAFSSIGYSADGNIAVLIVDRACGTLCGALSNVVVRRKDARWSVSVFQVEIMS